MMMKQVNPFLYKYLREHDSFSSLGYFLEELYDKATLKLADKNLQLDSKQELDRAAIQSLMKAMVSEPVEHYQILLDRLFNLKEQIQLSDIVELYEYYANKLLQNRIKS